MKVLDKPDSVGHWWTRYRFTKDQKYSSWYIDRVIRIENGKVLIADSEENYYLDNSIEYQFVKAEPPPNDLV